MGLNYLLSRHQVALMRATNASCAEARMRIAIWRTDMQSVSGCYAN